MSIPQVRVPLQMDKPRTLVIDFNALCRVEEVTGVNMLVGQPTFSSMRMTRALVWAGLLHEDPGLTLEQVGTMIQDADATVVLDAIMRAYNAAMPEEEEGEAAPPSDPPDLPPGEIFGQPADTT